MAESPALLAVFAHPDDETFRCGGTLALLAKRGVRVYLLTATRGEGGSCGDPPLCRPESLGGWREKELVCASRVLGLEPPILLDYRDGRLPEADPDEVVGQIVQVVRRLRPQAILSFGPDGLSGHPDHITIGRLAEEAFRRVGEQAGFSEQMGGIPAPYAPSRLYQVAVPHSLKERLDLKQVVAVPDEEVTLRVDVSPVWEQKTGAIRCHATQHNVTPILKAPLERQRLFLGIETFRLAASQRDDHRDPFHWTPDQLPD